MKNAARKSSGSTSAGKSADTSASKSAGTSRARSARKSAKKSERRTRGPRNRAKLAELQFRSWGGARAGAGRKPKGERAMLPHDTRPPHQARFPLLITTRLRSGLPSVRRPAEAARVRAAIASANGRSAASGAGAAPFQVVHHSIQSNHLHLIVEATDRAASSNGMRALLSRIACELNRLWKRNGSVFGDRFHERVLLNPRQVRHALVYVLQNLRKHGIRLLGPDPYSSGPEFDGWTVPGTPSDGTRKHADEVACPARRRHECPADRGGGHGRGTVGNRRCVESFGNRRCVRSAKSASARSGSDGSSCSSSSTAASTLLAPNASSAVTSWLRAARVEVPSPKTWLLGVGWRRHGPIDPAESPRSHG